MKRSKFSLSHYKLATMDLGYLVPLTWYEVIPGDSVQQATSALVRVTPLLSPVMHPVRVRIHHWFVPNRLIWEDFEDFITGGEDGTSTPEHPYIVLNGAIGGALYDNLGIPQATYSSFNVSALPFRAYQLIYNHNYRDQDLVDPAALSIASGQDSTTYKSLQKVAWEKDYFTTARPWEQKGDEVTIPLVGDAPVLGIGTKDQTWPYTNQQVYETGGSGTTTYAKARVFDSSASQHEQYVEEDPSNTGYPFIRADLSAVSGVTINDLRLALAIQRMQEARARYGSRYVEYLKYLGITPADGRLNNPEYLGGGRQTIQFSEVLQTAEGTDPVADMKGHGIGAVRTNRWRRFFGEHGIVMSLMSVVPKAIYCNSMDRAWFREVKEDYFTRELQFIGEQEIYYKETYSEHSTPDEIFGYQQRYDEYRQKHSRISGDFLGTLNHWHYGRIHSGDTALNQTYIECTPTKRVYADQAGKSLYVMSNHSIQARRPISARAKSRTF